MKLTAIFSALVLVSNLHGQIQRPMASPLGAVEQKVGLTDIRVQYSRPSKNGRVIFGDVVPYGEVWRTGANENTKITSSDALVFGTDTLKAGTYAIYTKPTEQQWEIIFYTDASNWGTPDEWDEKKVALRKSVKVTSSTEVAETFTIGLDKLTTNSAELTFKWDRTIVSLPFAVPTAMKMQASIDKIMAGPTAGDYYAAAEFYLKEKKDLKKALEWASKAVEMRKDAYWMYSLKAQLQAETGDYKGAIDTAKLAIPLAEKDGNTAYVEKNKASIDEWSKKK